MQGLRWVGLILGLLIFTQPAFSAEYSFKVGEIARLQIVGFEGQIEVKGTSSDRLKVEVVEVGNNQAPSGSTWSWTPTLRRSGTQAEIRVQGPLSKKDWQSVLTSGSWPRYKLRITGPALPLALFWRKADVQLSNWAAGVEAHLLEGKIRSSSGKGGFRASLQQGLIHLKSQEGRVELSGLDMDAKVEDLTGDLQVQSSRGEIALSSIKGLVTLENDEGKTKIVGLAGALNFTNGQGEISIREVAGGVDGQTTSGPVELNYSGEGEVQVGSQSGQVTLRVPKQAAPYVVVASEEGDLYVPSYFSVVRNSSGKTAKGRVRGGNREGSIKVTSKSADILLR